MQIALFQLKGSSKYFTAQLARELLLPNFTYQLSSSTAVSKMKIYGLQTADLPQTVLKLLMVEICAACGTIYASIILPLWLCYKVAVEINLCLLCL